jgi:hypothetical protein
VTGGLDALVESALNGLPQHHFRIAKEGITPRGNRLAKQ